MGVRVPLVGWGVGHHAQPLGLYCLVGMGGASGAGLNGDCGRGVQRPWVGLAGGHGVLSGVDDGALGDGDVDEGLDGVVFAGRLCGGGGRWSEGGVGCGGWGSWFGLGFGLGRCSLGLCRCFCGVVCACLGAGLGLGSVLRLGSGSRLRRTSVRRCEGTSAGSEVFPVRCRGA